MKFYFKKFLNFDGFGDNWVGMPIQDKSKVNYWINQLLIWLLIVSLVLLVIKFCVVTIN